MKLTNIFEDVVSPDVKAKLIKSDSVEFIKRLTGNTQISSKELKYLLPIHNE